MGENSNKLSRAELEEACLKQNIVIERKDPFTNAKMYLPNIEKINKMIREFDFLVDGSSRGKAVNEISKIERFLFDNEENPDLKSKFLATCYTSASMYIENHRSLLEDKRSENWKYLFVNYFKLEDIYNYFNKSVGASVFFKDYPIYNDMVDLTFNVKLMEYLRSQVALEIPVDDDKDMPGKLEEFSLKLVILHELGILDLIRKNEFDLVLMDLHMPEMDGIEATEIIRNSGEAGMKDLPVIALTAAIMSDHEDKVKELDFNDFILKPFKPRDLYMKILKNAR